MSFDCIDTLSRCTYKMALKPSISSDFSIDHILNRAGEKFNTKSQPQQQKQRYVKLEQYEAISSESSSGDESCVGDNFMRNCCQLESERFIEIPNFDWLNYTRYNMPRLSRPSKQPVKRTPGRLPRIPFTPYQLNELEKAYKNATYLSTEDANKLAKTLDLTGVRVKIWYQNRRARDRRERKDKLYRDSNASVGASTPLKPVDGSSGMSVDEEDEDIEVS